MIRSHNEHITALFVLAAYYWLIDQEENCSHMVMAAVDVLQHPPADA
jgi:hypothetical protein